MGAIFKKELISGSGTRIAFFVAILFLIITGLLFWVYPDSSLLDLGYASLQPFFDVVPWVLMLLSSAITMRLVSEERKSGTMETLLTKPVTEWGVIHAKYLASLLVVTCALVPTWLYVYSLFQLGSPVGNIDMDEVFGSYIGLVLLSAAFCAVGIFSSAITTNQVVAFLISLFLCFFCFSGFDSVSKLPGFSRIDLFLQKVGLSNHYKAISKGVMDTRDVVYFGSFIAIFLLLARLFLKEGKLSRPNWVGGKQGRVVAIAVFVIMALNAGGDRLFYRLDLTADHRFTLSNQTKKILHALSRPVKIKVFLEGEFPSGFKRLRQSTRELLDEFEAYSHGNVTFSFINPFSEENKKDSLATQLMDKGLSPISLTSKNERENVERTVFPCALVQVGTRERPLQLLQNQNQFAAVKGNEALINNSVENLEYLFIDGIQKLATQDSIHIGFLSGNGELQGPAIADFIKTIKTAYSIEEIDLNAVPLKQLVEETALVLIKPRTHFSEAEKYKLDQYLVRGGKLLAAVSNLNAEMDSMGKNGTTLAFPLDLNLDDLFFKYGLRINYDLVRDLNCAPIPVIKGQEAGSSQQDLEPWVYFPLVNPVAGNPIVKNIDPVRCQFLSTLDTLPRGSIKKEVLLYTSPYTKVAGSPVMVSLEQVAEPSDPQSFHGGRKMAAVIATGMVESAFKNRLLADRDPSLPYRLKDKPGALILFSDANIASNQINPIEHSIYPLGYDKYSGQVFGNKNLMMNSMDFLVQKDPLLTLRNKEITLRSLDKEKIAAQKTFWQLFNTFFPIGIVLLLWALWSIVRKSLYLSRFPIN